MARKAVWQSPAAAAAPAERIWVVYDEVWFLVALDKATVIAEAGEGAWNVIGVGSGPASSVENAKRIVEAVLAVRP